MSKIVKIIIGLTAIGCLILAVFYVIKQNSSSNSKPHSQDTNSQDTNSQDTNSQDNPLPPKPHNSPKKNEKDGDKLSNGLDNNNKSLPNTNLTSTPNKRGDKEKNKKLEFVSTKISDNTFKYHFQQGDSKMSFISFITALKIKDQKIFSVFQGALKDASAKLSAYFWECPPVSSENFNKDFEFTVIKSQKLNDMKQDYSSFKDILTETKDDNIEIQVHSFSSLGKDGILVIPGLRDNTDYKNLSQFTQNAPLAQQQELWKEVAEILSKELKNGPRWLSTHGLGQGTSYLHVRIYDNPKYYHMEEYKES